MLVSDPLTAPTVAGASGASQFLVVASLTAVFFVPLFFYIGGVLNLYRRDGQATSIVSAGFWRNTLFCWLLTMCAVGVPLAAYLLAHARGVISGDALTPLLLNIRFTFFLASLALLTAVLSVEASRLMPRRALTVSATVASLLLVLFPVIFSRGVVGLDSKTLIVNLARWTTADACVPTLILLAAVICGYIFARKIARRL